MTADILAKARAIIFDCDGTLVDSPPLYARAWVAGFRAAGADMLLTNKTPLSAATIQRLPSLRYVGVLATGYNIVDTAAARQAGITVTNIEAAASTIGHVRSESF